jgi:hypothetical protein
MYRCILRHSAEGRHDSFVMCKAIELHDKFVVQKLDGCRSALKDNLGTRSSNFSTPGLQKTSMLAGDISRLEEDICWSRLGYFRHPVSAEKDIWQ